VYRSPVNSSGVSGISNVCVMLCCDEFVDRPDASSLLSAISAA
jgi:hypothetical protein